MFVYYYYDSVQQTFNISDNKTHAMISKQNTIQPRMVDITDKTT